MSLGIPFKLESNKMMFAAMPTPRRPRQKPLTIDKFAPRRVPTDCLVLGHVGSERDCLNFALQTMSDYEAIRRKTLGFSASPKFWIAGHEGVTDKVFDPAQCALFGHDIDIVDEDVDVCWIKVHIASEPTPYPDRSDLMTQLYAAFEALTKASNIIEEIYMKSEMFIDVLDGIKEDEIQTAKKQLGQMLHMDMMDQGGT
jgi:hypothetical protein